MSAFFRKLVALTLMLWLPIFSMSAAAMVACPHGVKTGTAMPMDMGATDMGADMGNMAHAMHAGDHTAPMQHGPMQHGTDTHHPAPSHDCGQCGVCHIACTPGLVSTVAQLMPNAVDPDSMPLNTHFLSITLPIFDPPPLVRA